MIAANEAGLEQLLAAIENPAPQVQRDAVSTLKESLRIPSARERQQEAKAKRGRDALEAMDRVRGWMTSARNARVAAAVTAALERRKENPRELLSPDGYIELLGLTATRGDARALAVLEGLRARAGEPYRSEFEELDRENLPYPTSGLADKKGVLPGTPMMRVKSIHTGLLDLEKLEEAIARIKSRE